MSRHRRSGSARGLLCALALMAWTGCPTEEPPPDTEFDPELAAALQEALDLNRGAIHAPGATLAVRVPGQPDWATASGEADLDTPVAAAPEHRFRIGSITKSYVTAVVLQLVDEGQLELDAPLSAVLPDAPHADAVTLRQLLQHTAGYEDFVDDLDFLAVMDEPHTPDELLDFVRDLPLLFEPGTGYEYSNTHFVLAGMAIEQVTGTDYAVQVHQRLLAPLALTSTFLPSDDGVPPQMARGYLGDESSFTDVTEGIHGSNPWASGEMIADAHDLVRWGAALYGGEVLPAPLQEQMLTEAVLPGGATTGYGLGCYLEDQGGVPTAGHSGSTLGFQSRLRYHEGADGPIVTATLVNNFFAEADEIDAAVWDILLTW